MGIENPVHLLFIAVVALIVLGPKRLPGLARAVGKGVREFREAIGQGETPSERGEPVEQPQAIEPPQMVDPPQRVDPPQMVDPPQPVRSPDAPDRGPV